LFPDDPELMSQKEIYEKKYDKKVAEEKKNTIETARKNQEVSVDQARIAIQTNDELTKFIYPDMIQVIVRNNSNKVVKNIEVSNLAYDSNGLPVKIEGNFSLSEGTFEYLGRGENVNIVPNATFGKDNGWELTEHHGITTVLSCVKEVEYYDGSTWTNPYYPYWLEEHKEKPLKK
jgi:hypothetical protein